MQDRICQVDETLLQRTAGPYIRVKLRKTQSEQMFSDFPLKADIDWFSHPQWTAKRQSAPRGVHDKKVQG
jgi:hypothetical protein